MESISLKPLLTLSLLSSSPQNPKPPSNLKTLALKKLQSFSNGGLPSSAKLFGRDLLCRSSGGIGIGSMLMSTSAAFSVSKAKVSPFLWTLAGNPTFVSGVLAWVLAQSMKVFLNFFVEKRWDLGMLVNSGGMPSSHSALCTALTTSVAFCHGVRDSLFPVCLGFSLIVMYDAIGVRRHAGMQAETNYGGSLMENNYETLCDTS